MKILTWAKSLVGPLLVIAVVAGLWGFRDRLFPAAAPTDEANSETSTGGDELEILELSAQARKNLKLRSKAARPTDYWRTITIPGMVQDRPGVSDRGVVSPAVGIVTQIKAFPGDTLRAGEPVVGLRLFSEYLQNSQAQLFKADQETDIIQDRIDRIASLARVGGVSKAELTALRAELTRQEILIRTARQDLLTRGLRPEQIEKVQKEGTFVSTIEVTAPTSRLQGSESQDDSEDLVYEVQDLPVEVGQQVQAGQLLARLANHQKLYVVGHAFKSEADLLEEAARVSRPIDVQFADDNADVWSPLDQSFQIRHLSNSIDVESRTFDFFVPLENQSRNYEKNGETFLVWRFRPGQRVRIHVPLEKLENVFVLPSESIAREGPDAFVYRQNGDLFNQIAVNVLHEDRRFVVIANDGGITPGTFIAQNAGASLRRVLKSQSASGQQPGLHVHADGTVHAAH